jgi:predicted ATPase
VSLREAKFRDHWRRVFLRNFPTRFTSLTVTNLYCLADSTMTFSGGINAIVGGNGVGKSTLVAAIAQLLASDPNSTEEGYSARLSGSTIQGTAFNDGTELHLTVNGSGFEQRVLVGDQFNGEFRWLDPSTLASRCLHQIHTDQNFDDLLEPLAPLQLGAEDLKVATYLVGKSYSRILIYEISDYGGFDRFPYFRAASAGITYGSEGMGRGELSLLLAYWTLHDMPKNSILILEEPETHVSPKSQDSLMNIVAKFSDEMGMWVIVTTHSPTVIRRIPREHINLLARGTEPTSLISRATKLDIALLLGGGVAYRGVILVEDEFAKDFVLALFEKLDAEMVRQPEVIAAGSVTNITQLLRTMPRTRSWLTIIGLYDGDQRDEIDNQGLKWPFGFLPGDVSPEHLLMRAIENMPNIAALLGGRIGAACRTNMRGNG